MHEVAQNGFNNKERLANAQISSRQQCVYEGPWRRNIRQINARNTMLKRTFSGSQRCRWQSSFV